MLASHFTQHIPDRYVLQVEASKLVRMENEGKGHCLLYSFFTASQLPNRLPKVHQICIQIEFF